MWNICHDPHTYTPVYAPQSTCDTLNLHSGRLYSGIVSRHWRLLRQKDLWLSEKALTKLSDVRCSITRYPSTRPQHRAAQQGFFNACRTTRTMRKAGFPEAKFPWRQKTFRTTVWKNAAIKRKGTTLELSTGARHAKLLIALPPLLHSVLKVIEVRLMFNKQSRRYSWHIVAENGKTPKAAPGTNIVSVDPGEIHPAVIGDEHSATVITCRERRARQRGHAKNLKAFSVAFARKKKGIVSTRSSSGLAHGAKPSTLS